MTRPLDNPESCFICRRRAAGVAVMSGSFRSRSQKPAGWLCEQCGVALARKAYDMPDKEFDVFEQRAVQAAGEKAGAYLDQLGKTDLAQLSEPEWSVFCITMIRGFGEAIRAEVESGKAPF